MRSSIPPRNSSTFAILAAASLVACAGADKPADQAQSFGTQGGYPQQETPLPQGAPQQPAQPTQPAQQANLTPAPQSRAQTRTEVSPASAPAASGAPNPLPGVPLDPALLGQISSASLAILTPGGVAGDPIEAGIKVTATRYASNMQPEGQMAKDTLQENGHKEMLISLTGGKCYTIIGFSPAGQIRNLDLRLLAPPFYNMQAGQDDTTDGTPIIGKGAAPTCPITPFPLQYKLDIHAQKGTGPFGVQVFSRSK